MSWGAAGFRWVCRTNPNPPPPPLPKFLLSNPPPNLRPILKQQPGRLAIALISRHSRPNPPQPAPTRPHPPHPPRNLSLVLSLPFFLARALGTRLSQSLPYPLESLFEDRRGRLAVCNLFCVEFWHVRLCHRQQVRTRFVVSSVHVQELEAFFVDIVPSKLHAD